tara:strand:+ start:334 stop:1434 length:1101 start_codon:yes stop_codon:yes gene_type:complete
MHKQLNITYLLALILFLVNFSSANSYDSDQANEKNIWPQKEWLKSELDIKDVTDFEKFVNFTFSENSYKTLGRTNAVLVIKDGRIAFEKYNDPINEDTKLVSYSMAKSYIGLLTGIMLDRKYFQDIQQDNLLPEWQDNRKNISINHLLNMQSGLDFVEQYNVDGRSDTLEMLFGEGRYDQALFASTFKLKTPFPGMEYNYSTGETNILSMLIKNNLEDRGISYYDFINENLIKKIGIYNTIFEFDESGTFIGGSSVFANARDYARFGYLVLREGEWDGEQIVSRDWIKKTKVPAKNTYGMYSNQFWLLHPAFTRGLPKDTIYCAGYGGQYILIIPSRNMVVVRLGETYFENDKVLENLSEMINFFN